MFIPTKKGMSIQEIKVETGHSKIKSLLQRVQVHSRVHDHRNQVRNLRRDRVRSQARDHRSQVQDQVHNRRRDRVLSQVHDRQLAQVINFNAITKTEAEGIQIIITISTIVLRNQVTEVIRQGLSRDLNQDLVVAEAEGDRQKNKRLNYIIQPLF